MFDIKIKSKEWSINQLIVLVSCYLVIAINFPFLLKTWTAVTEQNVYNGWFLATVPVFLFCLVVIINCLFSFKVIIKPFLILMVFLSSVLLYGTLTYGVVFDHSMVQNIAETDNAEAFSYLNFSVVMFIAIVGVIPSIIIGKVKLQQTSALSSLKSRVQLFVSMLVIISIIAGAFYSNYAAVGRNNRDLVGYLTPYKFIDASYKFIRKTYFYPPLPFKTLDQSPTFADKNYKQVTVVVVGETARAKNFSLNGYDKHTNRYTDKKEVVSFTNVSSCGTATAVSLPCMFSRLNKSKYDKRVANAQQNLVDVIKAAGADVLWISNNNGSCKGVCVRVDSIQTKTDDSNPLCDGEVCFDEALIEPLTAKLNKLTNDNTFIVLHMIGSHGPTYFKRYPESKSLFKPDCRRSDIQNCSEEELVNTYDDTIAYTDFVLSQIIDKLAQTSEQTGIRTSMLYISDHGESLGENGVYLHGLPYAFAPEDQTHIPMIYWQDKSYSDQKRLCIREKSALPLSQDNLFDIVLGLTSIKSSTYNEENDPFSQCNLNDINFSASTTDLINMEKN